MGMVDFPIESKEVQLVDSGHTKVFLVVFNLHLTKDKGFCPSTNKSGDIFLDLEGTFSGDDMTSHKSSNNLTIYEISEFLRNQDSYDSYYFPYLGTKHHNKSIPFVNVLYLDSFDKTLEYYNDIYPWTCSFQDLTSDGKSIYLNWKKLYPNSEIRLLTMANI